MKTELYLVRHGETQWNVLGKFQGSSNIDLSDNGIKQAEYLSMRFQNNYDIIYSSPLNRALQTAEMISRNNPESKPIIHEDLTEINFGDWEGLTFHQIMEQYPSQFDAWKTDGSLMGGDLNVLSAGTRAKNAILDIAKSNAGRKIIAVAHGGIIKAGLVCLFDWKVPMYHSIFLDNTSVTKLIFTTNNNIILSTLNDTRHIPITE
ncbi:MAG: phosphoglycerate mutase-like protein [Anaerocolumna sp.]|jgi:probable phosphoglycerate mutase|nr:phosphoglycerate mutase-like protein [Anaerocolumna sp.]